MPPASAPPSPVPDPAATLATATDRLYEAFAAVGHRPDMFRCRGSVADEEVAALGGTVRDIPPALVARFLLKAGTTWGGPDDIRRIAPRALELAAQHQLPLDRSLAWAKFRWAGWPDWPTYQVVTVRAFLRAELGRLVRADPRPAHLAHAWLRQAAAGVDDLGPFLDEWHDALGHGGHPAHHRAATGHLVVLLVGSRLRPDHPDTIHDLLPGRPDQAAQLAAWLTGPDTRVHLERAADVLRDTTDARRVKLAQDRLLRFSLALEKAA